MQTGRLQQKRKEFSTWNSLVATLKIDNISIEHQGT
jgi:hypothetical protein